MRGPAPVPYGLLAPLHRELAGVVRRGGQEGGGLELRAAAGPAGPVVDGEVGPAARRSGWPWPRRRTCGRVTSGARRRRPGRPRRADLPPSPAHALEDAAVLRAVRPPRRGPRRRGRGDGGAPGPRRRAGLPARPRPYGLRTRAGGPRRPASGWGALTAAEVQVADPVGRGHSDPETAERPVLSRRTVENHAPHILAEAMARSRGEPPRSPTPGPDPRSRCQRRLRRCARSRLGSVFVV